jgi:hypothetical protein
MSTTITATAAGMCADPCTALVSRAPERTLPLRWALASATAVVVALPVAFLGAATGDAVGFFFGGPFDVATGFRVAGLLTGLGMFTLLRRRAVPVIATRTKDVTP